MQGAISIVHLNTGWHLVFWKSGTEWDRSLAIDFCPYCGQKLEEEEDA